jgi:hypothetical protein
MQKRSFQQYYTYPELPEDVIYFAAVKVEWKCSGIGRPTENILQKPE